MRGFFTPHPTYTDEDFRQVFEKIRETFELKDDGSDDEKITLILKLVGVGIRRAMNDYCDSERDKEYDEWLSNGYNVREDTMFYPDGDEDEDDEDEGDEPSEDESKDGKDKE